ncbi:MAG TPA: MFS transporter [Gaiellaceae bacterium]|nr:MFS transporter [Gaiellaceae bacterium]
MPRSEWRAGRARVAVTFVFFAHGALFGTWVARIPAVKADLGLGEAELGVALAGAAIGTLAALPVAGVTTARRGSRSGTAWGLPVFAALLPLLALAPSLPTLFLALFAFGAAAAMLDVAMNAHSLAVEQVRGRPILSSFHAGWSFGGLAGAALGAAAAASGLDPVANFVLAAVIFGVPGLALGRLLLPAEADRPEAPPRLAKPPRRLAALAVLAFCGLFAEGAAADWSAVYLDESVGSSAGTAALAYACFSIAMAVTRLAGDRLTTRWGPVTVTRVGALLAAAGLWAAIVVGTVPAAMVAFACMGVGIATVVPIVFRAAGSIPGLPAGAGIAALTTVGYAGFLVGPPLIGVVAEATSLPAALGIVVALLLLLASLARATRPASERLEPAVAEA